MNFIFISPQFPRVYWNFCDRLKKKGVNVLGIGDTPYDQLAHEVRESLTEYYFAPSLADYDQMLRAVAFFTFKYGRIDWIESNNEFWLESDARLRTDFNIRTGWQSSDMEHIKNKSAMKPYYKKAGIPTARLTKVTTLAPPPAEARGRGGGAPPTRPPPTGLRRCHGHLPHRQWR